MAPCAHSEIVVGRRSIWCPSGPTEAVAGVEGAAVVGGVTDLLQPATVSRQLATRTSELEFMTTPIAPHDEFSLPESYHRPLCEMLTGMNCLTRHKRHPLVVVNRLNVYRPLGTFGPLEVDPPPVVYPNTVLSFSITL